ncbi:MULTISPECIES: WD40 repeat domain-containing protein [unclassified Coleofasciculus]|uniref:WD40 repeat domain-containing protein n=1 Tax=unclassified Coleofasciculus TaxID=2692782 RepID=UPI001881E0FC|nr:MULTISPECIES: hypothetical protein [unclassified Coleofasciculus]MBE9125891.1 hypothetical protein [Coleofasciculus sp. LEGE 07081]MBE9149081.1 hypothetical protein [Coleofasciculus sp. LEGE 07092]
MEWDTLGNPIGQPFKGHEGWVISVAFSPDCKTLVSGSYDQTIRLWDTSGNPIGQPFKGHEEVAQDAGKTCQNSVWNKTQNAQFLVNQGRAIAREANID